MSMADFDAKIRREKNNLIAFDTFLSTSLFEHVAKGFACKDKRPTDESILLRIQINANEIGRPFADIRRLSAIGREGEILLSMGTVFRVVNVATEKNSEGLWIVDLVSANDDDALLKREGQKTQGMLLDFFKKVYLAQLKVDDDRQIAASCVNMASMYFRKEQYQTSLDLYKKSFDKLSKLSSPDPLTMATYKSNIAQAHRALKQTDAALELYKEALETRKKCCQENDPLRINTLHTIGNIYREKEEYDLALETYQQALELQTTQLPTNLEADPSSVAATLIYMAKVLNQQNQHQKALEHFDKALKYQHQHLSKDHPALAFLHNNIGAMYYKIGKYKEALAHHSTCLRIEVDSLPPEHITFIDSYRSMVETCAQLDKHVEALEYAEKLVHQCELHQEQSSEQLEEARELLDRVKTDHDVFNKWTDRFPDSSRYSRWMKIKDLFSSKNTVRMMHVFNDDRRKREEVLKRRTRREERRNDDKIQETYQKALFTCWASMTTFIGRVWGSCRPAFWFLEGRTRHFSSPSESERRTQALVETTESSTDWFDSWSRRWLIFHRDTVWVTSSVAYSPPAEYFVLSPGTIYPTRLCWTASKTFRVHRRYTCPNRGWKRLMRKSILDVEDYFG